MKSFAALRCLLPVALMIATALVAAAELRTWTDNSGKHQVEAELVAVENDTVRLRRANGKEITLPLERLSQADRDHLTNSDTPQDAALSDSEQLIEHAERFFADLRTKDREESFALLTAPARKLAEKSPIFGLPKPDKSKHAIRVGKPRIESKEASTPVVVRVGKQKVQTTLHFEREGTDWRIAAISAELPGGEKTIELDKGVEPKKVDPLLALVGKPLPIEGLMIDGKPFSSTDYRGKVVLVDFWATWCGPCRKEIPNILANHKKHHDRGFEVIAVSTDKNLEKLAEFVEAEQPPWVVLADRHPDNKQSMGGRYGIRYLPSMVLVGRDGKVAAVNCRGKALEPAIKKALRAPIGSVASTQDPTIVN